MSKKKEYINMNTKSTSKIPRSTDPVLYDDKITIINIAMNEGEDDVVYNDVMNVEEFLEEHSIRMEYCEESPLEDLKTQIRPPIIVGPSKIKRVRNNSDMTESSSSLYQESKRARLDREKEEKRKRLEQETEFSAEDLSLATVPGIEFDPKQRSFDLDELRPQPIIKKRRKLFTKEANKDTTYYARREKNNVAARRSREARRLKENQIALRVAHLERENTGLRQEVETSQFDLTRLTNLRDVLRHRLSQYE